MAHLLAFRFSWVRFMDGYNIGSGYMQILASNYKLEACEDFSFI